jgi:hypothetical protein
VDQILVSVRCRVRNGSPSSLRLGRRLSPPPLIPTTARFGVKRRDGETPGGLLGIGRGPAIAPPLSPPAAAPSVSAAGSGPALKNLPGLLAPAVLIIGLARLIEAPSPRSAETPFVSGGSSPKLEARS